MLRPFLGFVFATLALFIQLPSHAEIDEASLGKARSYPAAPSLAQAGSNEFIVWTNSGGYESLMPFKTIKPGTPICPQPPKLPIAAWINPPKMEPAISKTSQQHSLN